MFAKILMYHQQRHSQDRSCDTPKPHPEHEREKNNDRVKGQNGANHQVGVMKLSLDGGAQVKTATGINPSVSE